MIGCRREGPALSVQVWDTGAGIAAAYQARVFQEFEQLHNPERDRGKGLGLGLAIVRRLSVLLDHPVALQSAPGRGSCFRIRLPLCARGLRVEAAASALPALADSAGRCIAVIDDEAAAREAARLMLERWGHTVLLAGSADQLEQNPTDPSRRGFPTRR